MELNLSIAQILDLIGGSASADIDSATVVQHIRSLRNAQTGDMAIILDRGDASVFDAVSHDELARSCAGVFLAEKAFSPDKKFIIVSDALAAFTRLSAYAQERDSKIDAPSSIASTASVHSSAVVCSGATIGQNAHIGAQTFVGMGAVIGANVVLHPGVKILDRCIIGDNSIVHAGAVVGSDGFGYQVNRAGLKKIPHIGIVRLGCDVEIGANCMIDRACFDETIIGNGCKLDNGVHVAHNVQIGNHTVILALTGIAGSVVIGQGCQIGGQVGIRDHLTIGNGVKIVSKSVVMNNLKDGEVVAGMPAIPFSQWKRLTVALSKVPDALKKMNDVMPQYSGATKSWWKRLFH
jgi:UDP-3-O-[3-hydroxymyristoyl] glucosamine N-acyltransferase